MRVDKKEKSARMHASARLQHPLELVHKLQTDSGGGDNSRCMVWRG